MLEHLLCVYRLQSGFGQAGTMPLAFGCRMRVAYRPKVDACLRVDAVTSMAQAPGCGCM